MQCHHRSTKPGIFAVLIRSSTCDSSNETSMAVVPCRIPLDPAMSRSLPALEKGSRFMSLQACSNRSAAFSMESRDFGISALSFPSLEKIIKCLNKHWSACSMIAYDLGSWVYFLHKKLWLVAGFEPITFRSWVYCAEHKTYCLVTFLQLGFFCRLPDSVQFFKITMEDLRGTEFVANLSLDQWVVK